MSQNISYIAFQGAPGAFSDLACRSVFPNMESLSCGSFDEAFQCVADGRAELAMIPIENSIAGRVADVHRLIPKHELHIIGEHFSPISHCLLGVKGSSVESIKRIHSHVHAIPQCLKFIQKNKYHPIVASDTAAAAAYVAETGSSSEGAIASTLAAEIYNLEILKEDIQDENINTTRFIILSKKKNEIALSEKCITTMLFNVRHLPAALYKALGGFATHGINLLKLESYVDTQFQNAKFYIDVEGHADSDHFKSAMEELSFYAGTVKILGTYKSHPYREFLIQNGLTKEQA